MLIYSILFIGNAEAASIKKDVARGNMLYNNKKYDEAITSFNKALEKVPYDATVNYNLGNAFYKKGDFARAAESYKQAIVYSDSIRAKGDYNIGNAKYRIGNAAGAKDPASSPKVYQDSLAYYIEAMKLDPKDTDAKFNYEFVERQLKSVSQKAEQQEEKQQERQQQETRQQDNQEKNEQSSRQDEKKDKQDQGDSASSGGEKKEDKKKEEKEEGLEFYQKPEGMKEMSREEAKMLLESYGQEDETRKQVRLRRRPPDYPEPDKDW